MLMAAVGAYAWDISRSDEIAEGVTIGGVDVGGMTADEARELVDDELVEPLRKPVTVTFEGVKYQICPEKLEVASDVDGMVDRALDESQEGGLPTRVWRYATGGEVDVAIAPQITYSGKALDEFIAKVAAEVNREPVDASIEPSPTSLSPVKGQTASPSIADELRAKLESAVQSPRPAHGRAAGRDGRARGDHRGARGAVSDLPHGQPLELRAHAVEGPRAGRRPTRSRSAPRASTPRPASTTSRTWRSTRPGTSPTPTGPATSPAPSVPGGVPENPLKERWMGIYDGAGIHGTDDVGSLGSAASHGCVRMSIPDVIELYDQVDVGTPIYIG